MSTPRQIQAAISESRLLVAEAVLLRAELRRAREGSEAYLTLGIGTRRLRLQQTALAPVRVDAGV